MTAERQRGHSAIIGMTESGKTTLAKRMAHEYRRRGFGVLVLDPWKSPDWPADFVTADLGAFLRKAHASRRCALFVEEVGGFGRRPEFAWLFTQARHWGHATHYLSQYHSQVPPIVRSNCARLFLFRVSASSAKEWADDFAQPAIATLAASLAQFHFVSASRYAVPQVGVLVA